MFPLSLQHCRKNYYIYCIILFNWKCLQKNSTTVMDKLGPNLFKKDTLDSDVCDQSCWEEQLQGQRKIFPT